MSHFDLICITVEVDMWWWYYGILNLLLNALIIHYKRVSDSSLLITIFFLYAAVYLYFLSYLEDMINTLVKLSYGMFHDTISRNIKTHIATCAKEVYRYKYLLVKLKSIALNTSKILKTKNNILPMNFEQKNKTFMSFSFWLVFVSLKAEQPIRGTAWK